MTLLMMRLGDRCKICWVCFCYIVYLCRLCRLQGATYQDATLLSGGIKHACGYCLDYEVLDIVSVGIWRTLHNTNKGSVCSWLNLIWWFHSRMYSQIFLFIHKNATIIPKNVILSYALLHPSQDHHSPILSSSVSIAHMYCNPDHIRILPGPSL